MLMCWWLVVLCKVGCGCFVKLIIFCKLVSCCFCCGLMRFSMWWMNIWKIIMFFMVNLLVFVLCVSILVGIFVVFLVLMGFGIEWICLILFVSNLLLLMYFLRCKRCCWIILFMLMMKRKMVRVSWMIIIS